MQHSILRMLIFKSTIICFMWICLNMDVLFQTRSYQPSQTLHTCFNSSNLSEAQRIRHGQIPVQWYTAEEGDTDVDISVEDEAEKLAALLTVDPVVMLQEVVDPERKSGDVQEVSHRQVDQVDAELVALAYLEMNKGQSVEIKSQTKAFNANI